MSRRYTRLFVDNLSSSADLKDLQKKFERYGRLHQFDISMKDRSGYVEYESSRDASDCIKGLDNSKVEGKRVAVEYAYRRRRDSYDSRDRYDRYRDRDRRDRRDRPSSYSSKRGQIDYERRKVSYIH